MGKRGIELSFSTFIGLVLGFIVLVVFSQFLFFLVGLTQSTADEATLSMFENLVRDINNFDKLKTIGKVNPTDVSEVSYLKVPYFINDGFYLINGCGKSNNYDAICLCKDVDCKNIVKGGTAKISKSVTKVDIRTRVKPILLTITADHRGNLMLVQT